MEVVAVGMSYKTAPVGLLEKVGVTPSSYGDLLRRLLDEAGVAEAVVLCTCNRSEFYAASDDADGAVSRLAEFAVSSSGLPAEEVEPRLYKLRGVEAVRHIMSVAASLDSMVLGETQIQSQVKDALVRAAGAEAAGPVLQKLFSAALRAGKRVRASTGLGELTVSISSTAVELAGRAFGGLEGHSALVIGAGETAELTMPHLKSGGVDPIFVGSRTLARARNLAEKFGARAVRFERIGEALASADVVLVATGAPHYIVHWPEIEEAMFRRRNRPIFIVDMSVPRNVDPVVGDIPNVHLCNIDDLEQIAAINRTKRAAAVEDAEAIVEEEAAEFERWLGGREVVPTIVALREKIESIRRREEEKALKKLDHLSEGDREIVRRFARSLVGKILHGPTVRLKDDHDPGLQSELAESVRVLFGLGDDREPGARGGKRDTGAAAAKPAAMRRKAPPGGKAGAGHEPGAGDE